MNRGWIDLPGTLALRNGDLIPVRGFRPLMEGDELWELEVSRADDGEEVTILAKEIECLFFRPVNSVYVDVES